MKRLVLLLALLKCLIVFGQANGQPGGGKISRCQIFDKYGVKTFENEFYHFSSSCGYTLADFSNDGDKVTVKLSGGVIFIDVAGKQYELKKNAKKEGIFVGELKTYTLPAKENDIEVSKPGTYLTAKFTSLDLIIKWDTMNSVVIEVDTDKNTDLTGICNSAEKANVDNWSEPGGCGCGPPANCDVGMRGKALAFCRQIISDPKYRKCSKVVSEKMINGFLSICMANYCNCKPTNKNECLCGVVEAFSKTCSLTTGQPVEWRKPNFCPMKCPAGQEYRDCGQRQKACGEPDNLNIAKCVEGCVCPLQLYLYNRKCIPVTECPCNYDGAAYPPKSSVTQDCKVCTCVHNNKWNCPPGPPCMGEADVYGDPHYVTFDKKRFDFMGKCTYYMVKGIDFAIKADHYVYERGQFVKNYASRAPSYVKVLYLEYDMHEVALKPGPTATVDGVAVNQFPYCISGITISKPTGKKIIVELPNLVEVHWDGYSTAKTRVPTTMRGRIGGLLGNFNKNPNDDFTLPDGTVTKDPNQFGHSWVVEGTCEDENTDPVPHPCHSKPAQKPLAEKACAPLKTALFTNCKEYDAKLSYEACVYDCCLTSATQGEKCACTNLADHADKCGLQQWRKSVPVCTIPCPKGQVYNYCINPCESSCEYLNLNKDCNKRCIEGCSCPPGQTFNEENECVQIQKCKCKLNGKYFPAGFKFLEAGNTLQTCNKGKWISSQVKATGVGVHVPFTDLQSRCNKKKNSDYTACKNPNPLSCKNMHNYRKKSIQDCADGCECKEGFVLDTVADTCVKPENCPCFYNGQSYENNAIRRDFKQKCICKGNDWKCTPYPNRVDKCSVFGDTHIRNLDGKLISFKSTCEYILATAVLNKKSFTITTKSDAITITYTGTNGQTNKITVKKDGSNFENIGDISDFKSSKIAKLEDIGIKIVWNREGYLHIHFGNMWRNKVEGFCAHSKNPDKALNEENIRSLTDEWSVNQACFDVTFYNPTKEIFTEDDKPVATKCELIKGKMFNPCNKELPLDDYYNKCLVVARALMQNVNKDSAEEFYCQIFAAVAQECNDAGLPVNWRSKDQCPFECPDKGTKYSTCVSTCTCDMINESQNKICEDGSCVEGCVSTVCPAESVYTNDTLEECVSTDECAQIKCLKDLKNHGNNCVCIKGVVSCMTTTPKTTTTASTTPTTTARPVTTPRPPLPTSESQKDLSHIFTRINELLKQIKNPLVTEGLTKKDQQMVETFTNHMKMLQKEILCYANLSDRSKCICVNEESERCDQNEVTNRVQENDIRIQNKLDLLKLVESHLRCLLNVEKGCACINGQKICRDSSPTSKILIYTYFINGERHAVKYFYYLQKAKTELNCLSHLEKIPLEGCTCTNGQITCMVNQEGGQKENNDVKKELLNHYSRKVEEHLQCYSRLDSDTGHCQCEGAKKVCLEQHTPTPADKKFEVIEHYLPTVINTQQINTGFAADLECIKTITDDKCSCVDGKKVCSTSNVLTTPAPPVTTLPKSESQKDLSHILTKINQLLEQLKNPTVMEGLTNKDKQIVETFTKHMKMLQKEILCYANLSDRSKCICENEETELCDQNEVTNRLKENDIRIQNKLDLLNFVESHLRCLLNVEKGCACINGQKICKNNIPTSKTLIYTYFVNGERHIVKYFYYLQKAKTEMNCLSQLKKMPLEGCTCANGQITCSFDPESGEKEDNDAKKQLLGHYLRNVEDHLQCYTRLKLDTGRCRCEGATKICLEQHSPIPADNKFEVIEQYLPTVISGQQIDNGFTADLECVKTMTDDKCSCVDGKKVCPKPNIITTPGTPTTTIVPDVQRLSNIQVKLLNAFSIVQEQLPNFLETELMTKVTPRELETVKVFRDYISERDADINCLLVLSDFGKCKCDDGHETCSSENTEQYLPRNNIQMNNYLVLIENIEAQLTCLSTKVIENPTCACLNGHLICPDNMNADTRTKIIYEDSIEKDKSKVILYYFLNYATRELKCFSEVGDSKTTTCLHGKKTPTVGQDPNDVIKSNAKKTETHMAYVNTVQDQLLCYSRLKHDACSCEKGKEVCPENVQVVPENNNFILVEKYLQSPIDPNQFYAIFQSDVRCLESLSDSDNLCICEDGKKKCPGVGQEVEPEEKPDLDKTFTLVQDITTRIVCLTHRKSGCNDEEYNVNVPSKEKLQLKVYGSYINFIKTQLACLKSKSRSCKCVKGKQTCPGTVSNQEEGNEVKLYWEFLQHVDAQITCLLRVQRKSSPCFCVNGQEKCEDKKRSYILYPMLDRKVLVEPNNDLLYTYIEQQLQCFNNIVDKSIPCYCKNGNKICERQPDNQKNDINQDIIKIDAIDAKRQCFERTKNVECFKDGKSTTATASELAPADRKQVQNYGRLLDYARKQLECLKQSSNKCICAGFKAECSDRIIFPGTETGQHRREDQITTYRNYIHHIKSQLECLSTLDPKSRLCACIGGNRVCQETQFSNLIFPTIDLDDDITFNVHGFNLVENQIKCIESIKERTDLCVCLNGKATCGPPPTDRYTELKAKIPEEIQKLREVQLKLHCLVKTDDEYGCSVALSLSSATLPYKEIKEIVTPSDKKLIQTYIKYVPYISAQLECIKDVPENCLCSHGKELCDQRQIDKGRRDTAANYILSYMNFISFVKLQLHCLVHLKPNGEFCTCGSEKQCHSTPKSHRLVQLITFDYPESNEKELVYGFIDGQVRCVAYLNDRSGKCICFDGGLQVCSERPTQKTPTVNITNESTCGDTVCPPNTRLQKKCPTCCPTCVPQYCAITINGQKVIKKPGEKWTVNPCEKCHCLEDEGSFQTSCIRKQCNDIQDVNIEYKITQEEGECCPVLTPIGCKHEGKVHPLDSVIQRNPCVTISCGRNAEGTVIKKIDTTICDKSCSEGYEYKVIPGECCGTCQQIGCVVNNKLKTEGSKWSDQTGCLEFTCRKVNDIFVVTTGSKKC